MQIRPIPHPTIALAIIAAQIPTGMFSPNPPIWRVEATDVRMALT